MATQFKFSDDVLARLIEQAPLDVREVNGELAEAGIECFGGPPGYGIWLRCKVCGVEWSHAAYLEVVTAADLPDGWWLCPTGCNAEAKG